MQNSAAPVAASERNVVLDVLRAFALFGILVMNMPGFYGTFWSFTRPEHLYTALYDQVAMKITDVFFDGKFNALFSFLFGVGFSIQLARLHQRSASPVRVYVRRVVVLFVLGAMHALLLWDGDVLHIYAVLALVLLALRDCSDRTVLAVVIFSILIGPAISLVNFLTAVPGSEVEAKEAIVKLEQQARNAYAHGTYVDTISMRWASAKAYYLDPYTLFFYLQLLTTMLLGYLAGRRNWLALTPDNVARARALVTSASLVGLSAGVGYTVAENMTEPFKSSLAGVVAGALYNVHRPAMMLVYVSAAMVLMSKVDWKAILLSLAPAGRMPLTNYLGQSLICTTIFYNYGFGLYGQSGPAPGALLALGIWTCQIIYSQWWLRHFQFGPAEWAWRALTYGYRPAFRLPSASRVFTASQGD